MNRQQKIYQKIQSLRCQTEKLAASINDVCLANVLTEAVIKFTDAEKKMLDYQRQQELAQGQLLLG
jgi:hypothetical protein